MRWIAGSVADNVGLRARQLQIIPVEKRADCRFAGFRLQVVTPRLTSVGNFLNKKTEPSIPAFLSRDGYALRDEKSHRIANHSGPKRSRKTPHNGNYYCEDAAKD